MDTRFPVVLFTRKALPIAPTLQQYYLFYYDIIDWFIPPSSTIVASHDFD